jgi:probable HAF family extracellular repeat protein
VLTSINNLGDIVGFATSNYLTEPVRGFLLQNGHYALFDAPESDLGTCPNGINNKEVVVGWYFDVFGNKHGFRREGGVYTTLDYPGAFWTTANGINSHGQIVGAYGTSDGDSHGFLLNYGVYSTHDFPNTIGNQLTGINDDLDLVGSYNFNNNAFIATRTK